jgi:hypothetical protein
MTIVSMRRRAVLPYVFALLFSCFAGCSSQGDNTGIVEGTVKVDDTMANSGEVAFVVNGQRFVASIQPDGSYRALGVPVGQAQVSVANFELVIPKPKLDPMAGLGGPTKKKATAPPPVLEMQGGSTPVGKPVPIPAKYKLPESSGLTTIVAKGTNNFPIILSSK